MFPPLFSWRANLALLPPPGTLHLAAPSAGFFWRGRAPFKRAWYTSLGVGVGQIPRRADASHATSFHDSGGLGYRPPRGIALCGTLRPGIFGSRCPTRVGSAAGRRCPLRVTSRRKAAPISISAFGVKADVNHCVGECPLLAITGPFPRAKATFCRITPGATPLSPQTLPFVTHPGRDLCHCHAIKRTKSPDCAAAGQGASDDIPTHQAIAKKRTKRRK